MTNYEIVTLVLQLLTILGIGLYTWFTYNIMMSTKNQADALIRPYVVAYARPKTNSSLMMLVITNLGRGLAQNLSLEMDRPFFQLGKDTDIRSLPAFSNGVKGLAPGQELIYFLQGATILYSEKNDESKTPLVFAITATYEFGGQSFSDESVVDLNAMRATGVVTDSLIEMLKGIKDSMK